MPAPPVVPEGVQGPDVEDFPKVPASPTRDVETTRRARERGRVSSVFRRNGLATVRALWDYRGQKYDLEFKAGFVGACQDDAGVIRPHVGWYIAHAPAPHNGRTSFKRLIGT